MLIIKYLQEITVFYLYVLILSYYIRQYSYVSSDIVAIGITKTKELTIFNIIVFKAKKSYIKIYKERVFINPRRTL